MGMYIGINTPGKLLEVAGDMSCNKLFARTEQKCQPMDTDKYDSSTDIDVSGATDHKNFGFLKVTY